MEAVFLCNFDYVALPGCKGLELLSVIVENNLFKTCVSLFYRPPSSSSFIFDALRTHLESLSTTVFKLYFIGGL